MLTLAGFATILDDQGRILLVHRRDLDVWECPGGGVEQGETPWEAVVRETREETDLHIQVETVAGLYWRPIKNVLVVQFLCHPIDGEVQPTNESTAAEYFPADGLPDLVAPVVRERINDSLTTPGVFRTQDGPGAREFLASRSWPTEVAAQRRRTTERPLESAHRGPRAEWQVNQPRQRLCRDQRQEAYGPMTENKRIGKNDASTRSGASQPMIPMSSTKIIRKTRIASFWR